MASETTAVDERSGVTPARGSAFISAPRSVDTSILRRALLRRGLTPSSLADAEAGRSIADLIHGEIARADYVISVIGEGHSREDAFFELGIAHGLGKRVLLLVSRGSDLPPLLSGIPYLRTHPGDREAIEFGLDQILSAPVVRASPKVSAGWETRPIGEVADTLLERLGSLPSFRRTREYEMLDIVQKAIEATGVATMAPQRWTREPQADIAIWSDDFEPWIGNPFLIQLKAYPLRGSRLARTINQISQMMVQLKIRSGMLIHLGQSEAMETVGEATTARIFTLPAELFLRSLKHTGLGELLRHMENERIHGRG